MSQPPGAILITGAGKGIGKAVAQQLASTGKPIIANYYRDTEVINALCEEVIKNGGKIYPYQTDVADEQAVQKMITTSVDLFGPIGILINNAGIMFDHSLGEISAKEWERVLRVNLYGPFYCAHFCIPHMKTLGSGRIVNILSMAAFQGGAPHSYVASKAALWGITMSMARELAPKGITVNAITPGIFDTTFHPPELHTIYRAQARQTIPLGRLGEPTEIAKTVEFIINNSYMTGANVVVSGGALML